MKYLFAKKDYESLSSNEKTKPLLENNIELDTEKKSKDEKETLKKCRQCKRELSKNESEFNAKCEKCGCLSARLSQEDFDKLSLTVIENKKHTIDIDGVGLYEVPTEKDGRYLTLGNNQWVAHFKKFDNAETSYFRYIVASVAKQSKEIENLNEKIISQDSKIEKLLSEISRLNDNIEKLIKMQ